LTNPEDLAAARHKEIAKAREQIAKVEGALATSRERQEKLRNQITAAEMRDRENLGAALVDGKPEPPPEAAQVKAELARQEERTAALYAAYQAAHGEIPRLVAEHRAEWVRRGEQEMGKARSRYQKAIAALEAAREAMDGEATLVAWLQSGAASNAANDSLGGRHGTEAVSFDRTLEVLREDCEHLAAYPSRVANPAPVPEPRYEMAWTNKGW
jgi:chromosome segregation ATPase